MAIPEPLEKTNKRDPYRKLRRYDSRETEQMQALQGTPLASFKSRGAAFIIDLMFSLVFFFLLIALWCAGEYFLRHGSGTSGQTTFQDTLLEELSNAGLALRNPRTGDYTISVDPFKGALPSLVVGTYFALFTFLGNGRTPGKWLFNLRTISLVHTRMTLWQSIERSLGYFVSAAEGGFGFIQYFIHPNRRTTHDRIAETIVVKHVRNKKPSS